MKRCPSCQSAFPTNYTHCPRDGSSLAEAGEWTEGTLVRGKYQILAKVGQGGMAAVYKALHVRFKEPRALKVINPELANDVTFVRRFEQEAIITRRLQHPNAVRVEDIDEAEDGRPFIVMEYVEGGNLKDVIEREAPMPVARVCAIVKQIAAALDAAHALGLVHRDIKPSNIALLASSDQAERSRFPVNDRVIDRVKVLDFGIAKLKEAHLEDSKVHPLAHMTLTGTGMVIGTPAYMSPEQAKGLKGDQLDGRSDLYSLGVVAYQMLTGDLPLKADSTLELLMAHISTPPKPIHEARPDLNIPDTVAAVVMRCLEKNRELRPASGQALIDEIEAATGPVAGHGPVLPVQPSAATKMTPKHGTPQRTVELPVSPTVARQGGMPHSRSWLWAATAILIAGALGSAWYLGGRKPSAEQEGPRVASTSTETKPVAPPAEERLAPAPAQQPPATRPSGPTPGTSQAPVHSVKAPESAPKPAETAPIAAEAKSTPIRADDSGFIVPTSAAPTEQRAMLELRTNPPVVASVYFDGQPQGTTDLDGRLELSGLPPGNHILRVSSPNYELYHEGLDFAPGLNKKLIPLIPATPSVPNATVQPPSAPTTTAGQARADEAGPTFIVTYYHGFHFADGHLTVSKEGLVFNGGTDSFRLSCSEVVEAKALSKWAWGGSANVAFHVRERSKDYRFASRVRDAILKAISDTCNLH